MNILAKKIRFVLRCVLIAGVLAGLCFSSSEGIQLLPFPPAGERATTDDSFSGGKFKSYSLSVHNSAVNLGKTGGDVQKNIKFFECRAGLSGEPQQLGLLSDLPVQNNFEPTFFKNTALFVALSDRAPPIT